MSYVCSECQFPTLFPKLYNFNKHCKRFHEEGFTRTSVHPYACDFCRSEPTSEAAWRTHMEVRHVKKMAALRPVLAHIEFGDVVYRHPFRLGCCGVTASGKTHYIKSLLKTNRFDVTFDRLVLVYRHSARQYTTISGWNTRILKC